MAVKHATLAEVIEPEVYLSYQTVDDPEKTAFFESGIAVRNAELDAKAGSGGKILDIPFWKDLDQTAEPNYSDDSDTDATPGKLVAGEQVARNAYMNHGIQANDLVSEIAGSDAMARIRARFSTYWQRQFQRRVIATLNGVLADNVANDDGDMVHNIAVSSNTTPQAGNVWSREAFTGAAFTLGDRFQDTSAIAVHSIVYKRMVDNDDIEYIRPSDGSMAIPTFLGRRVIIDDGLPVREGASSTKTEYVSVLFQGGALGFGSHLPKNAVAVSRDEAAGRGAGVETLWERKTWLLHPLGFEFKSHTVTNNVTPSLANLALAANWDRVVDRKNVPLAFLITNG